MEDWGRGERGGGHYATAAWIDRDTSPCFSIFTFTGNSRNKKLLSILVYWISGNPGFILPKISTVLMFQVAGSVQCTHGIIKYSVWSILKAIHKSNSFQMYALKVFDKIISLQKFYLPIKGNSKSVRVNTATKSYRLKKKKLVQLSIVQKLTFQTDISCPSEALYFTICN